MHDPNDKGIPRLLKLALSTVRSHLFAIERKAGVDSRGELLALFIPESGDKSPSFSVFKEVSNFFQHPRTEDFE